MPTFNDFDMRGDFSGNEKGNVNSNSDAKIGL